MYFYRLVRGGEMDGGFVIIHIPIVLYYYYSCYLFSLLGGVALVSAFYRRCF